MIRQAGRWLVGLFLVMLVGQWAGQTCPAQESNIERRLKGESKPTEPTPPPEPQPAEDKKAAPRMRTPPPRKRSMPVAEPKPSTPPAEPAPKPLDILVTVNAPKADILIGETKVGVARRDQPLKLQLLPGIVRISAVSEHYLPFSQEVEIVPETKRLEIALDYDIGALFARYENPRTTNLVTAEEWEALVETANRHIEAGDLRIEYRALGLLGQGQLALRIGDTASAIPRLLEATRLVPTSSIANYALGLAYLAANQPAEAAVAFQRAITANPVLPMAHYGLGLALLRRGQSREAITSLERAEALGYARRSCRCSLPAHWWRSAPTELQSSVCGRLCCRLRSKSLSR
jgi:hypothetical protein